jgi:hypothetical protein
LALSEKIVADFRAQWPHLSAVSDADLAGYIVRRKGLFAQATGMPDEACFLGIGTENLVIDELQRLSRGLHGLNALISRDVGWTLTAPLRVEIAERMDEAVFAWQVGVNAVGRYRVRQSRLGTQDDDAPLASAPAPLSQASFFSQIRREDDGMMCTYDGGEYHSVINSSDLNVAPVHARVLSILIQVCRLPNTFPTLP